MADNIFPDAGGNRPPTLLTEWSHTSLTSRIEGMPSFSVPDTSLNTVLDIQGSGVIGFLAWIQGNATARTTTITVTIDDIVIANFTKVTTGVSSLNVIGFLNDTPAAASLNPEPFTRSLKIEIQSTSADTLFVDYDYYLT